MPLLIILIIKFATSGKQKSWRPCLDLHDCARKSDLLRPYSIITYVTSTSRTRYLVRFAGPTRLRPRQNFAASPLDSQFHQHPTKFLLITYSISKNSSHGAEQSSETEAQGASRAAQETCQNSLCRWCTTSRRSARTEISPDCPLRGRARDYNRHTKDAVSVPQLDKVENM